ncbi:MAG: hypothetical protein JW749_02070 [Sedimentisphaerales bacterium]|nr:hypothetical protein [Sedimentisphaerales bacterium]
MRKGKLGLQKEISRIFTGIMVPKKNAPDADESPAVSSPPVAAPSPPVSTPTPTPIQTPKPVAATPVPPVTKPVAPKPVVPQPVSPPPRPFVIPEPPQNTAQTTQPRGYEKHARIPSLYNPPVQKPPAPPANQTILEPPPPPPANKTVLEPPTANQTVYERPTASHNQNIYEPPPLPGPIAHEVKIDVIPKQKASSPLLKIWARISAKFAASNAAASQNAGRKKMMMLLMPVLGLVFIFVVFKLLIKPKPVRPPLPSAAAASGAQLAFDGKIHWVLPMVYPDNLRDPTVVGAVKSPEGTDDSGRLPVKGIVFSEDNPCAVIGNRIVSIGEVVQGATVVKINKDSVEFEMGDKKWTQEVER